MGNGYDDELSEHEKWENGELGSCDGFGNMRECSGMGMKYENWKSNGMKVTK